MKAIINTRGNWNNLNGVEAEILDITANIVVLNVPGKDAYYPEYFKHDEIIMLN